MDKHRLEQEEEEKFSMWYVEYELGTPTVDLSPFSVFYIVTRFLYT